MYHNSAKVLNESLGESEVSQGKCVKWSLCNAAILAEAEYWSDNKARNYDHFGRKKKKQKKKHR